MFWLTLCFTFELIIVYNKKVKYLRNSKFFIILSLLTYDRHQVFSPRMEYKTLTISSDIVLQLLKKHEADHRKPVSVQQPTLIINANLVLLTDVVRLLFKQYLETKF